MTSKRERIQLVVEECLRLWGENHSFSEQTILDAHPDLLPELATELSKLRFIMQANRKVFDPSAEESDADANHGSRASDLDSAENASADVATCREAQLTTDTIGRQLLELAGDLDLRAADVDGFIDRYRIEQLLGSGGFGKVHLAFDSELHRMVAVKVPHPRRIASEADIETYLREARIVASLDHPGIVPVYDVGRTGTGMCYVVSKYIDGRNLAGVIHNNPLGNRQAAEIVRAIAAALHYAHGQGVVHRDIKPGNILIDSRGAAYVTDFGLAIREEDYTNVSGVVGTPAYMSPEQARGEGHLIDGRSDVFSLGAVLYELLTGERPFQGRDAKELIQSILRSDMRSPRELNRNIPCELERICLKAMANLAMDRYETAAQFVDDLDHYLALSADSAQLVSGAAAVEPDSSRRLDAILRHMIPVVPKGLRWFDGHDADFFLSLLPGPRDRAGVPESIRFWHQRIKERSAAASFRVGILYGPSGCGKSSIIRAGIVPRLEQDLTSVIVECSPTGSVADLHHSVQALMPEARESTTLTGLLATVRRQGGAVRGRKLLIVLDQFEQLLQASPSNDARELVRALRHCDGQNLQCLLVVRDDFWLPLRRFMNELEIPIVDGINSQLVDLFDCRHAKRVLEYFGRAFGTLPTGVQPLSRAQHKFLDLAVDQLQENERVVAVRLAVFSEMMKGKEWDVATLKDLGGAAGLGVRFLEESLGERATLEHRRHHRAATAVLSRLLPSNDVSIKGNRQSRHELLAVSGYANVPSEFDALLRILDAELKLITPADAEGRHEASAEPHFQLTHDYLVPSVREWLTSNQRETR